MNKEDIIYFSVNNWICGQDYPPIKNIYDWLSDSNSEGFKNNEWCKKNKLCVYWGYIDLSVNYTIAAPKEWIEKNCPELLTDEEYTYKLEHYDYKTKESVIDTYTKKYSDFVYKFNNNEEIICNDLKAINSDKNIKLIDTRILSDPITWIYEEYNKIKYNK